MLALKELRIKNREPSKQCLLDLPDELLDEVVRFLYTDNGRFTRDLIPASATCSRLRKATVPILFRNLHIRITRKGVDKRTFNILLNLDLAPHTFACHVRHMKQDDSPRAGEHGCEDLELSNELVLAVVTRGLRALVNLRRLRLVLEPCIAAHGSKSDLYLALAALIALCLASCRRPFSGDL